MTQSTGITRWFNLLSRDKKKSRRRSRSTSGRWGSRLSFETLEAREMLATTPILFNIPTDVATRGVEVAAFAQLTAPYTPSGQTQLPANTFVYFDPTVGPSGDYTAATTANDFSFDLTITGGQASFQLPDAFVKGGQIVISVGSAPSLPTLRSQRRLRLADGRHQSDFLFRPVRIHDRWQRNQHRRLVGRSDRLPVYDHHESGGTQSGQRWRRHFAKPRQRLQSLRRIHCLARRLSRRIQAKPDLRQRLPHPRAKPPDRRHARLGAAGPAWPCPKRLQQGRQARNPDTLLLLGHRSWFRGRRIGRRQLDAGRAVQQIG